MLIIEILVASYVVFLILALISWIWFSNKKINIEKIKFEGIQFTVIVPVRNEAKNIERLLRSFENQSIPKDNFEIIIVDDFSNDETLDFLIKYKIESKINLTVLNQVTKSASPKKAAITQAINLAKGKYIFTTDGDCKIPENLLLSYLKTFEGNNQIKFIAGPVTFFKETKSVFKYIWNEIQTVEFASLIGVSAIMMNQKRPIMCSGANLTYKKDIFFEVDGYSGNDHLASGDDEFLMHKVSNKYPDALLYVQNKACVVETNSCETIRDFYQQRKRWSSKWNNGFSMVNTLMAIFIFVVNVLGIILLFNNPYLLLFKIGMEVVFLSILLLFFKKHQSIFFIPLVQIIYPFYVCFFGVVALFSSKKYIWKERSIS